MTYTLKPQIEAKFSEPSLTAAIAPAIQQALAALLTAWTEIGTQDIIIRLEGRPVAVLIPYTDYQRLQQEDILTDLRDGAEAKQVYQAWLADPTTARPYNEVRAELVAEGLLDE